MEKHSLFLKVIIIEKFLLGIAFTAASFGAISLINKEMGPYASSLVTLFNLDIEKSYVQELVDWLTNVRNNTIIGISAGLFILASLNFVEAYGLHKRERWAEWLTVIATGLFIPLEIYEVAHKQTLFRVGALVINVTIVYYLARHKELFHKRNSWFREGGL